jgi:hypothetical protein
MIKPTSITEQLLFSTVRLKTSGGVGTGFFFTFKIGDKIAPVIITNKHVVNNKNIEDVNFLLHVADGGAPTDENIAITYKAIWIFHPTMDLCFCFVNPLFEQVKSNLSKDIYYTPITEDLVRDDNKLEELEAVENILMYGTPIGLWDEKNNLPLIRKGITASHPAIDFNSESIGVVDLSVFPGSSGSPLFIINAHGYGDKKGTYHMGRGRIILIGILFAGPIFNQNGEISIQDIPTNKKLITTTPLMINLGYYIKAKEILVLKKLAEDLINKTKT